MEQPNPIPLIPERNRALSRDNQTFSTVNDSSSSDENMTEPLQPPDKKEDITASRKISNFQSKVDSGSSLFSVSSDDDSESDSDQDSVYRRQAGDASVGSESDGESVTGRKETKLAGKLRLVVIALFVGMGILFPIVIYTTTRSSEEENFEDSFVGLSTKLIDTVEGRLARKFESVESLRIAATSHVRTANATWPFVTLPDFDLRAGNVGDLGDIMSIGLHPYVTLENREEWENYSVENIAWLEESIGRHENNGLFLEIEVDDGQHRLLRLPDIDPSLGFSKEIFALDATAENLGMSVDESDGPYFPTWQIFPPVASAVNLNAMTLQASDGALPTLVATGNAVLSRTELLNSTDSGPDADFYNFLVQDFLGTDQTTGALALIFYPLFSGFEPVPQHVVGMFASVFSFEAFFNDVLPPIVDQRESLVCVVENRCGDIFSYKITGAQSKYLGPRDQHDKAFDGMVQEYNFNWLSHSSTFDETNVRLNQDFCPYSLRVYPDQDMYTAHITNQPAVFAVSFASVVFFVLVLSLTYDFFTQRRIRRVKKTANENRAIVSSLFPENVRTRMIQEEEDRKRAEESNRRGSGDALAANRRQSMFPRRRVSGDGSSRRSSNDGRRNSNEGGTGIADYSYIPLANAVVGLTSTAVAGLAGMALAPPKLLLKSFLNEHKNSSTQRPYDSEMQGGASLDDETEAKPIADLFPHCTVLFADISGFTAWSSEREPEQVFTLLQAIFKKFDSLARKRDIFKVETIGDCYVAVTGLPDPQPDHAVRMTKFARACMHSCAKITKKLEVSLGPGTGDLRMRFGLHSGPVTAGVLRGEKSRFQLFGDTVNTASRMESTGQRNRIQVSQSTADQLIEKGKENWIQAREDVVHAKGKGAIQTYWVLTRRQTPSVIADERPKFIQSNLHDSNSSDMESVGSGNISVWDEEEHLDESAIGSFELPTMMRGKKSDRLIDWQVDLLLRLIKQILAGRDPSIALISSPSTVIEPSCTVYEEVSESIEIPKFDPEAARKRARLSTVDVPEVVIAELRDFVSTIASRYRDNSFHNFAHANHVSMSANKLLSRIVTPENVNYHRTNVKAVASDLHDYTYGITSDPLTQFAIMFSTLVHDVDHTGVSNQQRETEEPELAKKYKNKSVAEQNSIDLAWNLLMDPKFKNLQHALFATETEVRRFRQLLVNLVMSTDIFEPTQKSTRNMRWDKVFHSDLRETVDDTTFRSLKATIVTEHIIQAADVCHTMQHWQVYTKWNERLFFEMYRAFQDGRSPKDPSEGWYKGELWFFDNYVIPLAKKLEECGVFGVTSDECLNYALENRKEWEVKGQNIVKEMVEKLVDPRKNPSHLSKKPDEKPRRRGSFGYYARRSATFTMAMPKGSTHGKSGNEAEKRGESTSGDNDDDSIELVLNDISKADKEDKNDSKSPVNVDLGESTSSSCRRASPAVEESAPKTISIPASIPDKNSVDMKAAPVHNPTSEHEFDSDDDDSIVFNA